MTYSVTRLGAYDMMKQAMSNKGTKKLSMGELVICGSSAGALGGIAGNPADIILVRMVADPTKPVAQRVNYRNALQGLYAMVSKEGVGSLARGLAPNTIRAMLMNVRLASVWAAVHDIDRTTQASQLVSYDYFKDLLLSHQILANGMPCHFVASALAGTVATTICAPADVVKSRIMNMQHGATNQGPIGILTESLKKEGPRFLFKGWLPAWIRLTPNTIFMFVFLEQLKNVVDLVRS
ncbi:hypothetical protein P7C73_g88, partial [Tremellales sp. Uapishka_1]